VSSEHPLHLPPLVFDHRQARGFVPVAEQVGGERRRAGEERRLVPAENLASDLRARHDDDMDGSELEGQGAGAGSLVEHAVDPPEHRGLVPDQLVHVADERQRGRAWG